MEAGHAATAAGAVQAVQAADDAHLRRVARAARQQDAKFSFKAGGASGADALVQSTVSTPGDSQSVGYRLGKVGNDWKIYDIDMSGAWLIQVYQGQFKSQLASGGIDGLIAYLQKHNSRTN